MTVARSDGKRFSLLAIVAPVCVCICECVCECVIVKKINRLLYTLLDDWVDFILIDPRWRAGLVPMVSVS